MNTKNQGKGSFLCLCALVMFMSALLHAQAFGATAPALTKLLSISTPTYPNMAASDKNGTLYVADSYTKAIQVFNSDGSFRTSIGLSAQPTALAVSPSNLLYVGQNAVGSSYIEAFSADGTALSRTNGFYLLKAMAFTAAGELFVIDGHLVKKLDAAMNTLQQYGGFGILVHPKALAVSELSGEVYLLDNGAKATENGNANTPVWRIVVLSAADLGAGISRTFSNYGFGIDGKLGSAAGLAADKAGRLYISDNSQGVVAVYDGTGATLATVFDPAATVNPVQLSINNDRLYIVSGLGKYVSVYGIDSFADLKAVPASLEISYQQGAGSIQRTITLANAGTQEAAWSAGSGTAWLSVAQTGGTLAGNSEQALSVSVVAAETAGFTVGSTYSGSISISYNGGSLQIPVRLAMIDAPVLTVSPAAISIAKRINETPGPVAVDITISNDVSGSKTWQAVSNADWLSIVPGTVKTTTVNNISTTTTTALVSLTNSPAHSINTTAGNYTGLISVSADGVTGSPAAVTVSLAVVSTGKVTVKTDNRDASFRITGPDQIYFGSGLSYTIDAAAPGTYTVAFNPVAGFKTPAQQKQTLGDGRELVISASYADLKRRASIIASHGAGASDPSEIAVFDADGAPVLSFVPFNYMFGANTAVGDFDGDGAMDILASSGGGNSVPAIVKGFNRNGGPIAGLAFTAYTQKTGVTITAGDFDGDRKDEIVTGDASTSSVIRIFTFDALSGVVSDTGVYITAYPSLSGGVSVAAADVDGDGIPELITAPRGGSENSDIRIFKINTSAGIGNWTAAQVTTFAACSLRPAVGRNQVPGTQETRLTITTADTDGDGNAEILVACANFPKSEINTFNSAGALLTSFTTGSSRMDNIAAGDLTQDGSAEILLGDAQVNRANIIKIYNNAGQPLNSFKPFGNSFGVKVTVGNLGY